MEEALIAYQARLAGDATLASMITSFNGAPAVFIGRVPEGASMPFIVITGPVSDLPRDDKGSKQGRELLLDFRVTMRASGSTKQVSLAGGRMRELLHRSAVAVAGYTPVYEEALGPVYDNQDDMYSMVLSLRVQLGSS